ncbi:MAG: YgaP family membrane protein [Ginsengibacter sp.]
MKERIIRVVAGLILLISVALSHFVNINWIWLSVFVGINLFQSGITKFCPLEKILGYCGVKDKVNSNNQC